MKLRLFQQIALSDVDTVQLKSCIPSSTVRYWISKTLKNNYNPLHTVSLTIRWVDETEGRELNRKYRSVLEGGIDKNYATNVLTFVYELNNQPNQINTVNADIVLCWPILLKESKEQFKPIRHHAAHLMIHGVLHALGFDHETEDEAYIMEQLESKLLGELNISNPY